MVEAACETVGTCNTDQKSFKAYLSRWMAASTKMAPFIYDTVMQKLQGSAKAAAAQCTGGASKSLCGLVWTNNGVWDGSQGVGEQMSALEVVQGLLVPQVKGPGPVTQATGGTSKGNPSAGTTPTTWSGGHPAGPVTGGDRFGAAALTAASVVLICGVSLWIVTGA